jgi:hypothetical protein
VRICAITEERSKTDLNERKEEARRGGAFLPNQDDYSENDEAYDDDDEANDDNAAAPPAARIRIGDAVENTPVRPGPVRFWSSAGRDRVERR